jgi:hypothetical protein
MKMTAQEANKICAHLVTAQTLLKKSERQTASISERIRTIEGNMRPGDPAYVGDAGAAKNALDVVVEDLARLSRMRPAVVAQNEGRIPSAKPELPPGVADAINQIGKAVQILRLARDG